MNYTPVPYVSDNPLCKLRAAFVYKFHALCKTSDDLVWTFFDDKSYPQTVSPATLKTSAIAVFINMLDDIYEEAVIDAYTECMVFSCKAKFSMFQSLGTLRSEDKILHVSSSALMRIINLTHCIRFEEAVEHVKELAREKAVACEWGQDPKYGEIMSHLYHTYVYRGHFAQSPVIESLFAWHIVATMNAHFWQ
eukprot:401943-Pleurochrysis_carterae.AAC.1